MHGQTYIKFRKFVVWWLYYSICSASPPPLLFIPSSASSSCFYGAAPAPRTWDLQWGRVALWRVFRVLSCPSVSRKQCPFRTHRRLNTACYQDEWAKPRNVQTKALLFASCIGGHWNGRHCTLPLFSPVFMLIFTQLVPGLLFLRRLAVHSWVGRDHLLWGFAAMILTT